MLKDSNPNEEEKFEKHRDTNFFAHLTGFRGNFSLIEQVVSLKMCGSPFLRLSFHCNIVPND